MTEPQHTMSLGIAGFSYADLFQPSRLRDLHDAFCARDAADEEKPCRISCYHLT